VRAIEHIGDPIMADLIGQKLDRYTITALLGEGGMATVYRAHQETVGRDVAIKVIESRLARNPDFLNASSARCAPSARSATHIS
jgi:serine/threonine-protein kinase